MIGISERGKINFINIDELGNLDLHHRMQYLMLIMVDSFCVTILLFDYDVSDLHLLHREGDYGTILLLCLLFLFFCLILLKQSYVGLVALILHRWDTIARCKCPLSMA